MKPQPSSDPAALRRAAEARLKSRPATRPPETEADLRRLQHELEVHQIELEMQNEELRASQAEIKAGLERYTELFDFAPAGCFNLTADGTIGLVNLTGARLLGSECARLLGRRFGLFVAETDRRAFHDFLARVFASDGKQTCELTLADDARPPLIVNVKATRSPDGRECRVVVIDITERKGEEAKLAASERHLRAIFDTEPECVKLLAADGALLEMNAAGLRMLEADSFAQVENHCVYPLVAEEHRAAFRAFTEGVFRGESGELEFELIGLKGGRRWLETHATPLRDAAGGVSALLGITRDITQQKQAEEAQRTSREQLRSFARRLQTVREEERTSIAREIHDVLAQELTRLKLDLSWLSRRVGRAVNESTRTELAQKICSMTELADVTIESVQKLATELRPVVLDNLGLGPAIEWQVEEFHNRTGLACTVRVSSELPALDPAQATALFRIVQESLTNVIRHAAAHRVEVALDVEDGHLRLTVRDDGRGITAEELASMKSIGLLGMKERAALLGGETIIAPAPGGGTLVRVTTPLPGVENQGRQA